MQRLPPRLRLLELLVAVRLAGSPVVQRQGLERGVGLQRPRNGHAGLVADAPPCKAQLLQGAVHPQRPRHRHAGAIAEPRADNLERLQHAVRHQSLGHGDASPLADAEAASIREVQGPQRIAGSGDLGARAARAGREEGQHLRQRRHGRVAQQPASELQGFDLLVGFQGLRKRDAGGVPDGKALHHDRLQNAVDLQRIGESDASNVDLGPPEAEVEQQDVVYHQPLQREIVGAHSVQQRQEGHRGQAGAH
mmetsp:Transcript_6640/g.17985  ORF Transcript_6640/g.17985 Transcript_6640/m.17985 type:complete len:250 (-) Transcript_6640:114-863(-)